jgi:hypothetical protein
MATEGRTAEMQANIEAERQLQQQEEEALSPDDDDGGTIT